MTDRSENGWSVLGRDQLVWFTAAGERFAAANEHVAVLAAYFIGRYNDEVESIAGKVLDDWSFASRNVRGSLTEISNHASATAWDMNATEHPRGVHGTFSPKKTLAVRRILADVERITGIPVFRWGNDYRPPTPIDSMHVEINIGEHSAAIAAEKLTAHLEDTVTRLDPADIKAIAADVVTLLTTQRVVPNQRLHPTDPAQADFTFSGVLSNIELNQDQENERTAKDRELAAAARQQIAEIHTVITTKP